MLQSDFVLAPEGTFKAFWSRVLGHSCCPQEQALGNLFSTSEDHQGSAAQTRLPHHPHCCKREQPCCRACWGEGWPQQEHSLQGPVLTIIKPAPDLACLQTFCYFWKGWILTRHILSKKKGETNKKLGWGGWGVSFQYVDDWGRFPSRCQTAVSCFLSLPKAREGFYWVLNEWDKTDDFFDTA